MENLYVQRGKGTLQVNEANKTRAYPLFQGSYKKTATIFKDFSRTTFNFQGLPTAVPGKQFHRSKKMHVPNPF